MSSRRRRRSSAGQFVTGQMMRRMPPSVQFAFENRARGMTTLVLVGALIGTGIISVQWQDGKPKVEFHAERAEQVKDRVVQEVREVHDKFDANGNRLPVGQNEPLGEVLDDYPPSDWNTSRVPAPGYSRPTGASWQ